MIDSTIIDRVLAALDNVGSRYRRTSTGYTAQCPAHDDRKPSLSVSLGDKGVVLHCNAGAACSAEDVVAALGLQLSDLFPPAVRRRNENGARPPQPAVVAQYDYHVADGTLVFRKLRYADKRFAVQHPNGTGWTWGIGKAPRVLYQLPAVLDAVREGRRVWIVEGEKDADRLAGLGEVATCNFDGASKADQRPKWRDAYSDALTGAHVVIVADNDDPGRLHAEAIEKSLTGKAASVQVLRGLVDAPGADVSDHLDAGHTLADLVPLKPEPIPPRRVVLTLSSEVTMRRTRWLWDNRIPLGGLTLLAGREGLGKSTLAVALTALVTRGELPGEMHGSPRNVIYINSEDARDFTITPRLAAAGADRNRVAFADVLVADDTATAMVLPLDTDLLAEQVLEFDAVMVVLDAATSVIDGKLDGDKDRQMRQALEAIGRNVGERTGAAVLGIVHFGKRDSSDTGKLILGSIAWSQVARSTLAVALDADAGHLVVTGSKSNLGPTDTASVACRVEAATVDTPEGPTSVSRVVWLGDTDTDARDLLDGGEQSAVRVEVNEAWRWLLDFLGQGRVKSSTAKREAKAAGFSERTVERARARLKVQVTSEGFPRVTYWSLPAHDDQEPSGAMSSRARGSAHGATGATTTTTTTTTTTDQHLYSGATKVTNGGATGPTDGATGVRGATVNAGLTDAQERSLSDPHGDRRNSGATTRSTPVAPSSQDLMAPLWRNRGTSENTAENDPENTVTPVAPQAHARAREAGDPGGDAWVHAHLATRPVTVARLVTELDATTGAVSDALTRLASAGLAQSHPGDPQTWSLPTHKEPS